MDVSTAKAQLAEAEAGETLRAAKAAYQTDPTVKNKARFNKAKQNLVAARDEWRLNHRAAPNGPGDGTASPAPVEVSLEVN